MKNTTKHFIKKAKEIHGNKYGYSKTEYVNNRAKVCIICPEHGEFWQSPYLHTNGSGCPKCAKMLNGASKRLTKCDFLAKAKEIHGDKYDYSNVEYITAKNIVICFVEDKRNFFWSVIIII